MQNVYSYTHAALVFDSSSYFFLYMLYMPVMALDMKLWWISALLHHLQISLVIAAFMLAW